MADDDFDIDIYGDVDQELTTPAFNTLKEEPKVKTESADTLAEHKVVQIPSSQERLCNESKDVVDASLPSKPLDDEQQIQTIDESSQSVANIPKLAPQQQGTKRKEGSGERLVEPGATAALMLSDLQWWHTDDDIRGWVNQAGCEDELIDVTFSEHKVNGKSKGQAYVEFDSHQAATAVKLKIEVLGEGQQFVKKPTAKYADDGSNPFKTNLKDVIPKAAGSLGAQNAGRGGYENRGNNFRGRGNFQNNLNRGNSNIGGSFRGNFNNTAMSNRGGFQNQMGGFQPPNNGMMGQNFGGYNMNMINMRGGMNAMRGRGGMNSGMMGAPMGGMGMGMGMPMGINNMGFPGIGFPQMPPQYNATFYQPQQLQQQQQQLSPSQGQNTDQAQSGAKRPRHE